MKKYLSIIIFFLVASVCMPLLCACNAGTEQPDKEKNADKTMAVSDANGENVTKASIETIVIGKAIELDPSLTVLRTANGNMILEKKEIESNTKTAQIEFEDMDTNITCEVKYIDLKGQRYFFSTDSDDLNENEEYCSIFDTKNKPYFFLQTFQPTFGNIFLVDKKTLEVSKLIPDVIDGVSREESYNKIKEDMMENPDAYEWATNWIKYEFFDEGYERLFFFAPFLKGEYPMWSIDVKTKETRFVTKDLTNYYMPSYMGNYNKYAIADRDNLLLLEDEVSNVNLNTNQRGSIKILPDATHLLEYSYPYAIFTASNDRIVKYNIETKNRDEFTNPIDALNVNSAHISKDGTYIAYDLSPPDEGIIVIDTKNKTSDLFLKGKLLDDYFWTEDGSLIVITSNDKYIKSSYKLLL